MTARHHRGCRNPRGRGRGFRSFRGGFTLTELLVVIGIIALLATLTVVSIKSLSNEARLSSGHNTVTAALGAARAFAMKNNQIVMVAFRPRLLANGQQQVTDVITAGWTGESYIASGSVFDRFVPVPNIATRSLPRGIKVACPMYGTSLSGEDTDSFWVTQSQLTAINQSSGVGEWPGEVLAILYGPDGTTLSRNAVSDSNASWIDINSDGMWQWGAASWSPPFPAVVSSSNYFLQKLATDETKINIAPFVAVYDDDEARLAMGAEDWTTQTAMDADLLDDATGYISKFADRIHFNRYTGVIMK